MRMKVFLPKGEPDWRSPLPKVEEYRRHGGLFGGKKKRCSVKDTETGVVYRSKSACGRALYQLVNGNRHDTFVWYKILNAFPGRFEEVDDEADNDGNDTG